MSLGRRTKINRPDAAVAPHLLHFADNELLWTLGRRGLLVAEDEDIFILSKVAVEVFERTVCSLWVEEIDGGDEGCVEDSPDYIKLPLEVIDTNGCNFDN